MQPGQRNQWLLLGVVFAMVVGLLALGYFLFLRPHYVVLVQGLRPGDAAPIVAELDKSGTPYRIADGGGTILVPDTKADATRVAIAGSDAAVRGEIGFELFNKSDMGLTNFAQKINYQRALQGELVRTIMQEDGVESARVHLALPERTLFRADRSEPKAAVTLAMKPGQTADAARVAGIQRLIAAAVPDLPETKVVVLDSAGRVISPVVALAPDARPSPDMEEKAAIESYYRARARRAIERKVPGLKFLLRVLALPIGETAAPSDPGVAASADWVPSGEGARRNFQVRLLFVSEAALSPADEELVRNAVMEATALDTALGDSLSFEIGPVDTPIYAAKPVTAIPAKTTSASADSEPASPRLDWLGVWISGAVGILVAVLVGWRLRRSSGAARLEDDDHVAFAARLRRQLNLADNDVVA